MKSQIVIGFLLIAPRLCHAQSQMCWALGDQAAFMVKDTFQAGQKRNDRLTHDSDNCPAGSLAFSDGVNKWCYVTSYRVKRANQNGYNDADGYAAGSCGHTSNVVDFGCFQKDACSALTANYYGMCDDLYALFPQDNVISNPTAIDCVNMQGPTSVGQWDDPYHIPWWFTQQTPSLAFTGYIYSDNADNVAVRCGTYRFAGTIDGNGVTNLRAVPTNPTAIAPWCYQSFTYHGVTDQCASQGKASNYDKTDEFDLWRLTAPYGLKTCARPVRAVPTTPPPWVKGTAMPSLPAAPFVKPITHSGERYVYLEWLPVATATNYDVYKSVNGAPFVLVGSVPALTVQVGNLTNDVPVRLYVKASNATGVSAASNVIAWTPRALPQPFLITSFASGPGFVTPTWGDSAGATGYRVKIRLDGQQGYTLVVDNLPASARSYRVPTTDGIGHVFVIEAFNANQQVIATPDHVTFFKTSPCGRRNCH